VACTASVNVASMNLRSGPGTGYTVLGSVNQSSTLPVGGVNKEGGWLLVKGPTGSAWIAQSSASLSGNCKSLPAFNIPIRNAVAPVVVQQGNAGGGQPAVGGQRGDDHRGEQGDDHGGDKGQEHDD
jgi:serine protease Do